MSLQGLVDIFYYVSCEISAEESNTSNQLSSKIFYNV